jgi:hypothetical protein
MASPSSFGGPVPLDHHDWEPPPITSWVQEVSRRKIALLHALPSSTESLSVWHCRCVPKRYGFGTLPGCERIERPALNSSCVEF